MSPHARQTLGDFGERLATEYLLQQGYQIVYPRWRCRLGEIDIVAREQDTIVFVEVKTRRGISSGSPEEAVTLSKQRKLRNLAAAYIQATYSDEVDPPPQRIDVIAVELTPSGKLLRIELYRNAVTGDLG